MARLTDTRIRQTKTGPNRIKLADDDGLYLLILPGGARSWRWRSERNGKERTITLGAYPAMSLVEARRARDAARGGRDTPSEPPPTPVMTFEQAAREWHGSQARMWAPHHAADVLMSLEREAFPALGAVPVGQVTAVAVLAVLQAVEARPAVEIAHRLRQRISAIMDRAVALGHATGNPVSSLRRVLAPVVRSGRRPAVTTLEDARAILIAAEAVPAHPVTRLALRMLALTAVRPGELRAARWEEFEGDIWTIPAARMKSTVERRGDTPDHIVPLAPAAVETLAAVRTLTG